MNADSKQASKVKPTLIWVPLPASVNWRGEGIAQTIENLSANIRSEHQHTVELVVSPFHAEQLDEAVLENKNIKINILRGLTKSPKLKVYSAAETRDMVVKQPLFMQLLRRAFPTFFKIFEFLASAKNRVAPTYFLMLMIYTLRYSHRNVWFPVPLVPYFHWFRKTKGFAFWDPFVFESDDYKASQKIMYKSLLRRLRITDYVTTQSDYNKQYLVSVCGFDPNKVAVIHLGNPSYAKYNSDSIGMATFREVLSNGFFTYSTYKGKKQEVEFKFLRDLGNNSILHKVLWDKADSSDTKYLLVSTQYRPYKGYSELFELFTALQEGATDGAQYTLLMTSKPPDWLLQKYPKVSNRLMVLERLRNRDHALLYRIADLVLHPSFKEGGLATYPMFEAASCGTPSISNIGRHTFEYSRHYKLDKADTPFFENFSHTPTLLKKVQLLLADPSEAERSVGLVLSNWRTWESAADEYIALWDGFVSKTNY